MEGPDLLAGWCLDIHRHIDTDILTDRETQTQGQRHSETDTDTDRQTERQTFTEIDRDT